MEDLSMFLINADLEEINGMTYLDKEIMYVSTTTKLVTLLSFAGIEIWIGEVWHIEEETYG